MRIRSYIAHKRAQNTNIILLFAYYLQILSYSAQKNPPESTNNSLQWTMHNDYSICTVYIHFHKYTKYIFVHFTKGFTQNNELFVVYTNTKIKNEIFVHCTHIFHIEMRIAYKNAQKNIQKVQIQNNYECFCTIPN